MSTHQAPIGDIAVIYRGIAETRRRSKRGKFLPNKTKYVVEKTPSLSPRSTTIICRDCHTRPAIKGGLCEICLKAVEAAHEVGAQLAVAFLNTRTV